jgi:hypothetical protein
MKKLLCLSLLLGIGVVFSKPVKAQGVTITLDPNTTYQTMTGWEAVAQAGHTECPFLGKPKANYEQYYPLYRDQLMYLAANDLGINRLRVPFSSASENPKDWFALYYDSDGTTVTRDEFKTHWTEVINDNNDPNVFDWSKFHFTSLEKSIDGVVLPLKQAVEASGRQFYINFHFNHSRASSPTGAQVIHFEQVENHEEYAELRTAEVLHVQQKYGWLPDSIDIVNEPRWSRGWRPEALANNLVATAQRLEGLGITPDFLAPSTVGLENGQESGAIYWFNQMVSLNPQVVSYLDEISFHRYSGITDANLNTIRDLASQYNMRTAQLERYDGGGTAQALHQDLKVANVSAWQQFALAYCGASDKGAAYYRIDQTDPDNPQIILGSRSKFLRQYFMHVDLYAKRISAITSSCGDNQTCGDIDPVAFVNPDCSYVVVIKADRLENFSIQGLPAGTYGIFYTTGDGVNPPIEYDVDLADQVIGAGQVLTTSMPRRGVMTIYGKNGQIVSPTPTPTNWKQMLVNWLGSFGDQNGDSKVNSLDWGKLVASP